MSRITQADVVRGAVQQLSKRGGYTADHYFASKVGDGYDVEGPGDHVGATCAIGGVEQAIWKLTGESVDTSLYGEIRERLARQEEPVLTGSETPRQKVYAAVMRKLNAKARKLFPELDGEQIATVEEVTFQGSRTVSRKRTLQVFNAVLADLEKTARS